MSRDSARCAICGGRFVTDADWFDRHTAAAGDVHAACCPCRAMLPVGS